VWSRRLRSTVDYGGGRAVTLRTLVAVVVVVAALYLLYYLFAGEWP